MAPVHVGRKGVWALETRILNRSHEAVSSDQPCALARRRRVAEARPHLDVEVGERGTVAIECGRRRPPPAAALITVHASDPLLVVCIVCDAQIDTQVMEAHAGRYQGSTAPKVDPQRLVEDTPSLNQDAEGALDRHAVGALLKIEGVVDARGGDDAWRDGEGGVGVDEVGCWKLAGRNLLAEVRRSPCEGVVGVGDLRR